MGRIRDMLDMELKLGQVLAGSFVTISTIVGLVTYVHVTFQTKADSTAEFAKYERRIEKIEDGFSDQAKIQTQIYGDVSRVRGILEAQMAERNRR